MASTKGIPALTYESMRKFEENAGQIADPISSIFYTTSILFGVSLSFERYMFCNYLHLHTTIFTYWKIIFWIITINMFSIIVNIPVFLNFDYARWFYLIRFLISMIFYVGFESMTYKEVNILFNHQFFFELFMTCFTNSQSQFMNSQPTRLSILSGQRNKQTFNDWLEKLCKFRIRD